MNRVSPDRISGLDDTVLKIAVVSNMNVIQNDGVLNDAVITYINLLEQYGVFYRTVDDTTAGDKAVVCHCFAVVLCRRKVLHLCLNAGLLAEEIVPNLL